MASATILLSLGACAGGAWVIWKAVGYVDEKLWRYRARRDLAFVKSRHQDDRHQGWIDLEQQNPELHKQMMFAMIGESNT